MMADHDEEEEDEEEEEVPEGTMTHYTYTELQVEETYLQRVTFCTTLEPGTWNRTFLGWNQTQYR